MTIPTAARTANARRSFVRDILKAASRPDVISFAGGLPNPACIPVAKIATAIQQVLSEQGPAALQYCTTEGHPALRQWIADRYRAAGVTVAPEQILITTGSQQALDLIGKVLVDPGDRVIVEDPTYIAALQSMRMYQADIHPVPLDSDGIDPEKLRAALTTSAKIVYCMPNFQNPTGLCYGESRRRQVVDLLLDSSTVLVEDDPYKELRFSGSALPPLATLLPQRTILLGTFSKIIAPGLRLGWICAPMELMEKLTIAKQAADLHSENLGQWVLHRLVTAPDFQDHLRFIRDSYRHQCDAMLAAIHRHLPPQFQCNRPDGGMFLWATLPPGKSALDLFHLAIEKGVAFVPGQAFHASGGGENTLRLSYSNCNPDQIDLGISRLAVALGRANRA